MMDDKTQVSQKVPQPDSSPVPTPAPAAFGEGPDDHHELPHDVGSGDLRWVWREVRKRVFIKLPFSLGVAEALQAVVPIVLDEDTFVVGLSSRDYPLSSHLTGTNVRNTIENILRQASRRYIHFEVIEGSTIEEWNEVKRRRSRAQEAVIAMVEQKGEEHHYEDVINQIVGEIRHRITASRDRGLPQVRAQLMFDVVPSLGDATEMLFHDPNTHEARRIMARALDRVANFLDVPAITLAVEVERYRRAQKPDIAKPVALPIKPAPISNPVKPAPAAADALSSNATLANPPSSLAAPTPAQNL